MKEMHGGYHAAFMNKTQINVPTVRPYNPASDVSESAFTSAVASVNKAQARQINCCVPRG
jgi:hypothetical protein